MIKNKYTLTALSLYINYFVHGIQAIILSQGAYYFAGKWNVSEADVFGIIAAIGIGKVGVMLFSGVLSDKFGRKPLVIIGMIGYIIFFGGLLFCNNGTLAYLLAICAGGATSFLDGASYPAIMEIYPQNTSVAMVILKGFIAISSAIFPLFVSFLHYHQLWFGWAVLLPFICMIVNIFFMLMQKFPLTSHQAQSVKPKTQTIEQRKIIVSANVLLMIFAFFCLATFYLWQQVATKYAIEVVKMSDVAARGVMSIFSIGSILAVMFSAFIMTKGIRDIAILVYYTCISTSMLILVYTIPTSFMMYLGSFAIGFFTAGGILQIGSALLSQFSPQRKGLNTSLYSICFAMATYIMPIMIKYFLQKNDFSNIVLLEIVLSGMSFIIVVLLTKAYKAVFGQSAYSIKQ